MLAGEPGELPAGGVLDAIESESVAGCIAAFYIARRGEGVCA